MNGKKHKLKRVILLFCSFCVLTAYAQKSPAKIVFKDGTILNGLGRLSGKNDIKFKLTKDSKGIKYSFDDLEYAELGDPFDPKKYVQFAVEGERHPLIVEEVIVGKISLYTITYPGQRAGYGTGVPGYNTGIPSNQDTYVRKGDEDVLVDYKRMLRKGKSKLNTLKHFFADCPSLVSKITKKEIKTSHFIDMVEYYNEQCK